MIIRIEAGPLLVSWDFADPTGSGWSWSLLSGKSLGEVSCGDTDHLSLERAILKAEERRSNHRADKDIKWMSSLSSQRCVWKQAWEQWGNTLINRFPPRSISS